MRTNDTKQIVASFYREILGREPEAGGAQTYEALIRRVGPGPAVAGMLRAFLSSEEYLQRRPASPAATNPFGQYGDRLINGQPVSHIISFGTHCLSSIILKNAGLKKYSLPFDWLFSSPELVLDCLRDDFAKFLDRGHYRSVTQRRAHGEPGADHQYYRDQYGIGDVFAHRDPSVDGDYHYTLRTVERFRRLMRSPAAKLFVVISQPRHALSNAFPTLVAELSRLTSHFEVLAIQLMEPTGEVGVSNMSLVSTMRPSAHAEHRLYQFTPSSREEGLGYFPDKLDELILLRLIQRYRLDLEASVQ